VIGIDPGLKGGIALIRNGELEQVLDMPMHDGQVDGAVIYEFIYQQSYMLGMYTSRPRVWIELVHSYPKQGVVSTFTFGQAYGIAIGAAQASGASINYARSQDWKAHFGLSADKKESSALARELFPDHLDRFKRVKDNGRAEAALIALYGLEHQPK
jgi:crossover junction endodeoxyribonuclease RuvC